MKHCPIIVSIAGSDCSGGAGIQADIKTISALGGYAASVITAVTAQNTLGVQGVYPLAPEIVSQQIHSVITDLAPDAVKIGMVANAGIVQAIAECLEKYKPRHIVYDPVMVSTSGRKLLDDTAIQAIRNELFPKTTLVTPNLDEISLLAGKRINNVAEMEEAGTFFSKEWNTAVLIKGGHLNSNEMTDVLCLPDGTSYRFMNEKIQSTNLHGTGCTLSSAIATFLAMGCTPEESVRQGKEYISNAIKGCADFKIGHGNGPLCHFFAPKKLQITE